MKFFLIAIFFALNVYTNESSYELEKIVFEKQESSSQGDLESDSLMDISSDQLESINSSSSSVDDLLRLSPAATTSRGPRSSSESVQVRGLDNNKIFVMIDGSRQRFQSAHTSMLGIDTENIKAVKIYKSASDTNFSNSIGGGVNFITIDPKDVLRRNKKSTSLFTTKFNSANQETGINAKSAFNNKKRSGLISISHAKSEDLRLSDGQVLPNSSYEDFAGLAKIKYKKFTFKLEHFNRADNSPIDPSLNPPVRIRDLFSENTTSRNNVALKYESKDDLKTNVYVNQYRQVKDRRQDNIVDTRTLTTTGLSIDKRLLYVSAGLEVFVDELSSDRNNQQIPSYPNASSQNASLYILNVAQLSSNLSLASNLKQHVYKLSSGSNQVNEAALTKGAKLEFSISDKLTTFASYSEGFNSARVNDVYAEGLHSVGEPGFFKDNFFITNENLKPETSQNYELGLIYKSELFNSNAFIELEGSLYQSDVRDYIYMQRIDRSFFEPEAATTQFVNISQVQLSGAELAASYLHSSFDMRLSYSQVRGKNLSEDIYLADLPADSYNLQIKYRFDRQNLTLGYLGHLALEQDRVNPQTIERTDSTSSYLIHSLFANKDIQNFNISLRVDNVGNKQYRRHASHLFEAQEDVKLSVRYIIDTI